MNQHLHGMDIYISEGSFRLLASQAEISWFVYSSVGVYVMAQRSFIAERSMQHVNLCLLCENVYANFLSICVLCKNPL